MTNGFVSRKHIIGNNWGTTTAFQVPQTSLMEKKWVLKSLLIVLFVIDDDSLISEWSKCDKTDIKTTIKSGQPRTRSMKESFVGKTSSSSP